MSSYAAPQRARQTVRFRGRVIAETPEDIVLEATDGSRGVISVLTADYEKNDLGEVEILVGAKVRIMQPPYTQFIGDSVSVMCEGYGSCCVGETEICCHNDEVVGPCEGYWRCP